MFDSWTWPVQTIEEVSEPMPRVRLVNAGDARGLARRRLPRPIFDFVDGGAEDEITLLANRAGFEALTFEPRYLLDVKDPDLSTRVLGETVRLPVLLDPVGQQRMFTREGELASARAAGKAGTLFVVSTATTRSLEEIAEVATGPLWAQIRLTAEKDQIDEFCARAKALGYKALCLAVDSPALGNRERDVRNQIVVPPRRDLAAWRWVGSKPGWFFDVLMGPRIENPEMPRDPSGNAAPAITGGQLLRMGGADAGWEKLRWLRDRWQGGLVLKGLTSAEDAVLAAEVGVDGIVVSNHGGRQLDGAPASIDALPRVVEAVRGRSVEVYLDSGVRRGADVVKAVALGATACLIGRPYIFALAAAGETGVSAVLEIFRTEIVRVLTLLGRARLTDVDGSVLRGGGVPAAAPALRAGREKAGARA